MGLIWTEGYESDRWREKRNANGSRGTNGGVRSSGGGRTGSYGGSSDVLLSAIDKDDLIIVGASFRANGGGGGSEYTLFELWGDATLTGWPATGAGGVQHLTVTIVSPVAGMPVTIRVRRGTSAGTILGTSLPFTLPATSASSIHVEIKARLHDSAGLVVIRVDETELLTLSGIDTKNGGTEGQFDRIFASPNYSYNDDLYIANEQGSVNTDFQGAKRVETLLPTASGATSNGVGSDGNSVNNYDLVDDIDPVSASDYVDLVATGDKDTYVHADSAQPTGNAVAGVFVWAYAYKTDAGSRSMIPVARLSGTESDGDAIVLLNDVGQFAGDVFETKPGGGAWTVADVNSAEFGVKAGA